MKNYLYQNMGQLAMVAVFATLACLGALDPVAAAIGGVMLNVSSKGIQELRERRNAAALEARKLLEDHTGDKWNKDVAAKVDAKYAEIEALDDQISRRQRQLDLEAEERVTQEIADASRRLPPADDGSPRARLNRLFNTWLRGGDQALTAEDYTFIRNTMSTTTSSEGGYTVPTDVAKSLVEALKEYGGVRDVADVLQTAAGNPMNFPTSDGTAEVGELIGENTTATVLDPSFGVASLNVFKYSSKIIAVPFELLQDSAIDIEAFVRGRIGQRIGRITNQHFTTGTGTGQPNGVVTASTQGKVGTTGQTTTVIYDDLVDLEHSVDPAYRKSKRCGWMMADSSVKVIRKIKDTTGRPIWTPGYELGIKERVPETLLGYGITVNQDVPAMAANAKSILFGDFSYYKVRDVMAATLFRFIDSAYAKLGQVAFLAWMRSGGNLVAVTGTPNPIKHYANSAT